MVHDRWWVFAGVRSLHADVSHRSDTDHQARQPCVRYCLSQAPGSSDSASHLRDLTIRNGGRPSRGQPVAAAVARWRAYRARKMAAFTRAGLRLCRSLSPPRAFDIRGCQTVHTSPVVSSQHSELVPEPEVVTSGTRFDPRILAYRGVTHESSPEALKDQCLGQHALVLGRPLEGPRGGGHRKPIGPPQWYIPLH